MVGSWRFSVFLLVVLVQAILNGAHEIKHGHGDMVTLAVTLLRFEAETWSMTHGTPLSQNAIAVKYAETEPGKIWWYIWWYMMIYDESTEKELKELHHFCRILQWFLASWRIWGSEMLRSPKCVGATGLSVAGGRVWHLLLGWWDLAASLPHPGGGDGPGNVDLETLKKQQKQTAFLVGGLEHEWIIFPIILGIIWNHLGMSSSQLTKSVIFQRGWKTTKQFSKCAGGLAGAELEKAAIWSWLLSEGGITNAILGAAESNHAAPGAMFWASFWSWFVSNRTNWRNS